ncbi:MAG: hypothetical protein EXR72_20840 [Myxococcales bacterium]|nr:hypothetical protein [Myxococcales bacterium]
MDLSVRRGFANRMVRSVARVSFACLLLCGCRAPGKSLSLADTTSGQTFDFVVSSLEIDADDAAPAAGFNFDGLFSTETEPLGCGAADRVSDLDPDQNEAGCVPTLESGCQGGVDNVLPWLVDSVDVVRRGDTLVGTGGVRGRLASHLMGGHIVWLIRVSGVDDLVNDNEVVVNIYHGFSGDPECSQLFGGEGHFLVDEASLLAPADMAQPRWTATGSITAGRLMVQGIHPGDLPLPLVTGSVVEVDIRTSLALSGLSATAGNLGLRAVASTVFELLAELMPRGRTAFGGLIPRLADLPAASGCGGDYAAPVGEIGMGARFSLIHATIVGTATEAPGGTCGSIPPGGSTP